MGGKDKAVSTVWNSQHSWDGNSKAVQGHAGLLGQDYKVGRHSRALQGRKTEAVNLSWGEVCYEAENFASVWMLSLMAFPKTQDWFGWDFFFLHRHFKFSIVSCKFSVNHNSFQGFVPGIIGVSHGALQFMAYEELKKGYNSYRSRPPNSKFVSKSPYPDSQRVWGAQYVYNICIGECTR